MDTSKEDLPGNYTIRIMGVSFHFQPMKKGETAVKCKASIKQYDALCNIVETSWRYNPTKLLTSAINETGQSFEGEVSFAFDHEYPDELKPGVTLDFLGTEIVIETIMFKQFVSEYAKMCLNEGKNQQVNFDNQDKEIQRLLMELSSKA